MENIDAPDVLPVILGGDIGAYSLARAFHEAYGIVPLVLSQADCHMCGDSSILVNRVVPHLERPAVLLSTLANTAECFSDRPLLLLGCGDWYVRLIVENRAVLEKSFIIPYIGEDLLNRLTEKDRFYELCAEVGVPAPRTVVFDASADGDDPATVTLPFPSPWWRSPHPRPPPLCRLPRQAEGVLPARRGGAAVDACGGAGQPLRGEIPHPGDDSRRRHEHAHSHHLLRP
ncbi:MAG: hypothetical protein ACLSDQ_07505 [Adlercreutzia equolifaciens]